MRVSSGEGFTSRQDARSPADIAAELGRLGVRHGDVVMVRASLRRLGPVEGGARGVIGGAASTLIATADLVAYGARWMEERLSGAPPA